MMSPRSLRFALASATMFLSLLAAHGTAMAKIDCFSCHDRAAFQMRLKHQPVADGECTTCHSPHVSRYKGMLQQKVQDLCYSCHTENTDEKSQAVVHQPVRQGECLGCHDPHSSNSNGLLKKPSSELCFTCHTGLAKKYKNNHAPYAKGQCSSCHQPHQSAQPYLLVKEAESLCLSCHPIASVRPKHPNYPAELGKCGSCHSPHGSDRPALIRNKLHDPYASGCKDCHAGVGVPVKVDTCLECHPEIGEQMASSHNHLVRYGENGCVACHSPHAGDDDRLLRGKERHVCGTCHEATFRRYEDNKFKHKMVGACTDCHSPHGSNHPAMAKAPINEVCASCHAQHSAFTHPIGERVFDPRTGQMMTCASCHASKGTDYPYHTRLSGAKDLCVQCHRDR